MRGAPSLVVALGVALVASGASRVAESQTISGTPPGHARANERVRPPAQTAPFWRQVRRPGSRRAEVLMRQATQFRVESAEALRSTPPRRHRSVAALRSAALRLERAVELLPDDPVPLFELASVWLELSTSGRAESDAASRARERALEAFVRIGREHPDFQPAEVAFQLAYLHHALGEVDEAIDQYRHTIGLAETAAAATTGEANLAEILMLRGDLEESALHYERAIEGARRGRNGFGEALAWLGLALCRDRLGEHRRALEATARGMSMASSLMLPYDVLRAPGVSFEPLRELYWYDALRFLVQADQTASGAERARNLRAARRGFRAYLAGAPPSDLFRGVAEAHVERIGEWLASGVAPY